MKEKTFKGVYALGNDIDNDREEDLVEDESDTGSNESRKVYPAKVKLGGV